MVTDIKDYKQIKNREKKKSFLRRFGKNLFFLFLGLSLLLALILFAPFFRVAHVDLAGLFILNQDNFTAQVEEVKGRNIVFLNKKEIREQFAGNSYVEQVEIHRKFINRVEIQITERTPVAILVTNDGFIQINEAAVFLDISQTPKNFQLPLITGIELYAIPGVGKKIENQGLAEALAIIQEGNPVLIEKIAEINIENNRVVAYTRNGITVLLGGSENIRTKFEILEGILKDVVNVTVPIQEIAHIDLRFKDTYVIKRIQD